MAEIVYDIAVVGGGIAGYTAALTAKSLRLSLLWVGTQFFGGKLAAAERVRNFPSFSGSGEAFASLMREQCLSENIAFETARIDGIYKGEEFLLTAGKKSFSARTVVLCTGVELRGAVRGERDFVGRGVSYCAVCDGALYRDKTVAAVISSEHWAGEAEYLADFARTVHVFPLFEGAHFRAENIVTHRERPVEVGGEGRVRFVGTEKGQLAVDGVFFLRDAAPPSVLVGGLETEGPHVKVKRDMSTNLSGLFAAGDVTGTPYQYAKAAGEGLVAAYSAKAYLEQKKSVKTQKE